MRARLKNPAIGFVALAGLMISGAAPVLPQPAEGDSVQRHAHIGDVSLDDLTVTEARIARLYDERDPSGRSGAGITVTYRPSQGGARRDRDTGMRMYRTGVMGFEPTLGILPNGTLVAQGQRRGPVSLESIVIASKNGSSWRDVSPRESSGNSYEHGYTQDPYLTVDRDTGRIFTTDLLFPAPGQMLSYSDDAGKSWTTTVMAIEQTDHQTMFAGPPAPEDATRGYDNAVYNCAANVYATAVASAATTCVKSLDGGDTWRLTGMPPFVNDPTAGPGTANVPGQCSGLTGHGHVGTDGTIYLPRGWCGQPWLGISRDGGLTWDIARVADNGMAASDTGPPDDLPQPSHEAAVTSDKAGNIYYSWIATDLLPYLAISRDGGLSWSKPVRISPPGLTQSALPSIAIAPHAPVGKIALAYMGSTNAPGAPYQIAAAAYEGATWNAYVTVAQNALAKDPRLTTATLNDPKYPLVIGKCGTLRCGAQYEFIDIQVALDGTPWVVAIDGCFGAPAGGPGPCASIGQLIAGEMTGIRLR